MSRLSRIVTILVVCLASLTSFGRTASAAVTVSSPQPGQLKIKSDAAADTIDVDGTGPVGAVDVFVNGVFNAHFNGITKLVIEMGDGDDLINLSAVKVNEVIIEAGLGADETDIDNTTTLSAAGDSQTTIGTLTAAHDGNPGDFLQIDPTASLPVNVTGTATLSGLADVDINGNGGTFNVEATDVNVGQLVLKTGVSADVDGDGLTIDLDDINVSGVSKVNGGNGADDVRIIDSSFTGALKLGLGKGGDVLDLDGGAAEASKFGSATFQGKSGIDTIDQNPANIFGSPPKIGGFETIT